METTPSRAHIPLKSLRDLERRLGVDRNQLRHLAEDWHSQYSPFQQTKKAKPHASILKPLKTRNIDNPSTDLKLVQRKILRQLLLPAGLPYFLFGAVPKRGITDHALEHLGADTVVKLDIKDYYPSITSKHVYQVWSEVLNCSPPIASLLTKLTTFKWHLPQGAPTSPTLANLYLASICRPMLDECSKTEVKVTAWVDDLTFSGRDARSVIQIVRQTLAARGLKLSASKTEILGGRKAKLVTGIRLGSKQLRAPTNKLREIRAGIHNVKIGRFTDRGREADIVSLRGQIAHIKSICSTDATRLERALDSCN